MNISPTIKYPIDPKDCSFLDSLFDCTLFLQTVLSIKCLQEWYNLQAIDINKLDWRIDTVQEHPVYILPSIGNIELHTNNMVYIKPSTSVNTIYYYYTELPEECLSMVWFQLCSILVSSNAYKQSIDCKLIVEDILFKQFDPLLVDCIKNNTLEFINIDTCPSFDYLVSQSLKAFSYVTNIRQSPIYPKIDLLSSFFKSEEEQIHFIHRCNHILNTCTYLLKTQTHHMNVFKYPKIDTTIRVIYPQEEVTTNYIADIKGVYTFWLSGGNIQLHPLRIHSLLLMYHQSCYQEIFSQYISQVHPIRSYPYTLKQVQSVKDMNALREVVGKFLYGKRRTGKQEDTISELCRNYHTLDDLTFYRECKQYYHPSPFDRSIARIRELDGFNLWDKLQAPYLDFGGGDGQNAYAISKKMGFKKGEVFVSDIQSWFGNENVEKYKDICTYRFLKTYKCPFDNDTFSFITCFQVLHHIRDYMVSLRELYRICKPGGILYIREHDAITEETKTLIDIEHSLHEVSGNEYVSPGYLQDYFAHYFTKSELESLLLSVGFKPMVDSKTGKQYTTEPVGPTRYTISIWIK